MKTLFLTVLISCIGFFQNSAQAAQTAVIDVDIAPILNIPQMGAPMVEKVRRGTTVTLSNVPTEGFYKVRLPSGVVGWIPIDAIRLDIPSVPGVAGASGLSPGVSPNAVVSGDEDLAKPVYLIPPVPWTETPMELRAFGGMSYINPADFNQYFATTLFNSALDFGAELGVRFTPHLYGVARIEKISKTVSATDTNPSNNTSYAIELASTPFYIGLEYAIAREKRFSVDLVVLGGVGFSTSLASVALGKTEPNLTEYGSSPFTYLTKLNGNFRITRKFGLFSEGGYRFLRTAPIIPNKVGTGSEVFQSGGTYPPTIIDLSGFFLGAGLVLFL